MRLFFTVMGLMLCVVALGRLVKDGDHHVPQTIQFGDMYRVVLPNGDRCYFTTNGIYDCFLKDGSRKTGMGSFITWAERRETGDAWVEPKGAAIKHHQLRPP